jgi:hypothetical protein
MFHGYRQRDIYRGDQMKAIFLAKVSLAEF